MNLYFRLKMRHYLKKITFQKTKKRYDGFMKTLPKVALIRLDRIGDLCCTLPVDEVIKDQEITWIINKGLGFIPSLSLPQRKFTEFSIQNTWSNFKVLYQYLKNEKFNSVILFHAPWWVSLAVFMARIPLRVSSQSQWPSWIFFNKTLKQKRSRSTQHEFEYNLDLVLYAFQIPRKDSFKKIYLQLEAPAQQEILKKFHFEPKNYFVVHAGMSGSALNWPIEKYEELILKLALKNKVVMTGTKADDKYLQPLSHLKKNSQIVWLQDLLKTDELIFILKNASVVIGPSTGVMHLAAAAGAPCITLFSPLRVQSATRWAPRSEKSITISPPVSGSVTPDCMNQITVDEVMEKIQVYA